MTKGQKRILEKGLQYARENRTQPKTKDELRMIASVQRGMLLVLYILAFTASVQLILNIYNQ
jgi:hypothetical protein